MVAGIPEPGNVAENWCRMVVVVVGLAAWALLCSGFRAYPVGGEDSGRDHKGLVLVDSHVEELVGGKEVGSYCSVVDGYLLLQMDCEKSAAVAGYPVS